MEIFACRNINEDVRIKSSSGGIFSVFAESILKEKGIIYGVAMAEECYSAEYIRVTDPKELGRLRGSKYLQAKIGNTYKKVKQDLLDGKKVLFTGTGCQVNGLRGFLQNEYENLICVDVICHGTPSKALWKKYVLYQEKKYGKLQTVNFRCKDNSWTNFGMKENELYISKDNDVYMQMFLRNYSLRPSCYKCVAKKKKMADITIADFWGIENIVPELDDGKGTSLMLVRTEKGEQFLDKIRDNIIIKKVKYEDAVKCNPSEYKSVEKPDLRTDFYTDMNSLSFEELAKKYAAPRKVSLATRAKWKVKKIMKKLLMPILKKFKWGGQTRKLNSDYGVLFVFEKLE